MAVFTYVSALHYSNDRKLGSGRNTVFYTLIVLLAPPPLAGTSTINIYAEERGKEGGRDRETEREKSNRSGWLVMGGVRWRVRVCFCLYTTNNPSYNDINQSKKDNHTKLRIIEESGAKKSGKIITYYFAEGGV